MNTKEKHNLIRKIQNKVRQLYGDNDYPIITDIILMRDNWHVYLIDGQGWVTTTDLLNRQCGLCHE